MAHRLIVQGIGGLLLLAGATIQARAEPLPRPATFGACAVCHKVNAGEKSVLGPNLSGVGGRKAAALPDYPYSAALKAAKITWTRDKLIAFLTAPQKAVPGTKMAYAGQPNAEQAALLADYVLSLK